MQSTVSSSKDFWNESWGDGTTYICLFCRIDYEVLRHALRGKGNPQKKWVNSSHARMQRKLYSQQKQRRKKSYIIAVVVEESELWCLKLQSFCPQTKLCHTRHLCLWYQVAWCLCPEIWGVCLQIWIALHRLRPLPVALQSTVVNSTTRTRVSSQGETSLPLVTERARRTAGQLTLAGAMGLRVHGRFGHCVM